MNLIGIAAVACLMSCLFTALATGPMSAVRNNLMAFGVRVQPERARPFTRVLGWMLLTQLCLFTAGNMAIDRWGPADKSSWRIGLLGVVLVGSRLWYRARSRQMMKERLEPPAVRVAQLSSVAPAPGGWLPVALPLAIPAGVIAFLATRQTAVVAYVPAGLALLTLIFSAVLIGLIRKDSRTAPENSDAAHRGAIVLRILVTGMWAMAAAVSSCSVLAAIDQTAAVGFLRALPIGIVLAGFAINVLMGGRLSKLTRVPADLTPNECWKWGRYYFNPKDSALLVEQRLGSLYTFNFAHWQSWVLSGVARLAMVVLMLLCWTGR